MWLLWKMRNHVQHFNYDKYWRMRDYIQNQQKRDIRSLMYAYRVKRMDAFANASTGIKFPGGGSAVFVSHPRLPHGLYGIIIAPGSVIGENVRICHQVTIGTDFKDISHVPTIGNYVEIYPGAKIIGKVHVGDYAKIGPNAVVYQDVPEHAVVVAAETRMILKSDTLEDNNN